jgi:hypothetical protein
MIQVIKSIGHRAWGNAVGGWRSAALEVGGLPHGAKEDFELRIDEGIEHRVKDQENRLPLTFTIYC